MSQYLQLHFFLSSPSQVSFPFSYYFYNATSKFSCSNKLLWSHFSPICRNLNCPYQNLQNWHFVVSGKRQPTLSTFYWVVCLLVQASVTTWEVKALIRDTSVVFSYFYLVLFSAVHYRSAFLTVISSDNSTDSINFSFRSLGARNRTLDRKYNTQISHPWQAPAPISITALERAPPWLRGCAPLSTPGSTQRVRKSQ